MNRLFALVAAALLCAAPAAAQTLDDALAHFYAGRFDESHDILQALVDASPDDARLRAWLAENRVRQGDLDGGLALARQTLAIDPCNAQAHTLIANAHVVEWSREGAADSAFAASERAWQCDPADGNAWLASWSAALGRRDTVAARVAQARLAGLGWVPDAVLERGRWMLRSAPANAVMLTNGDWDYYPMAIAQTVEGVRPDVYLVQRVYIEFPWYVRRVSRETGLPMPPQVADLSDDEWMPSGADTTRTLPFQAGEVWARATLDGSGRPLVVAMTAQPDVVGDVAWVRWDGALYTLHPREHAPADGELRVDEAAFTASMAHLDLARLATPIVHPSDRSPIRRTDTHPAASVLIPVTYYGIQRYDAGDLQGARQALAWADALIATGQVPEDRAAYIAELRAALDAAGPDGAP